MAKGQLLNNKINVFLHNYQDQAFSDAYIYAYVVQNYLNLFLNCGGCLVKMGLHETFRKVKFHEVTALLCVSINLT